MLNSKNFGKLDKETKHVLSGWERVVKGQGGDERLREKRKTTPFLTHSSLPTFSKKNLTEKRVLYTNTLHIRIESAILFL